MKKYFVVEKIRQRNTIVLEEQEHLLPKNILKSDDAIEYNKAQCYLNFRGKISFVIQCVMMNPILSSIFRAPHNKASQCRYDDTKEFGKVMKKYLVVEKIRQRNTIVLDEQEHLLPKMTTKRCIKRALHIRYVAQTF
jgi:hypothetical protein